MQVSDAMTPSSELVTVSLPGTRDDVLSYLQEYGFSSVPVVKEIDGTDVYRGIVSRDDLIERPEENQLALLMHEVQTIEPDAELTAAAERVLTDGARRIPVVKGDEDAPTLEGIVTVTDLVRAIARGEINGDAVVETLASDRINTTYVETPLPIVERELSHANVPYAIVLGRDGRMAGIVTEVDIIEVAEVVEGEAATGDSIANQDSEWAWEGIKAVGNRYLPTRNVEIPNGPVEEFMTGDVVTVSKQRTAQEAAQAMISNDVEQIPVVSGGELIGIVRDVDLLRAI